MFKKLLSITNNVVAVKLFFTLVIFHILALTSYAQQCQFMPCTVQIPYERLPSISAQKTLLWCWASSAQAIFRYYGYEVSQDRIVTQTTGAPIITTANAPMMVAMLNKRYTDDYGRRFSVRTSKIYDAISWLSANPRYMASIGAQPLDNQGIRDALPNGRPIIYGTSNHAMVLTALIYTEMNGYVFPQGGWVLDPSPSPYMYGIAVGLRPLQFHEMRAFFGAEVIVTPGW